MTMAMSWVRSVRNTEEMIIAADSRLRFGGHWDCCPKIMPLPRQDSVMCFSGNTMYAYPVMIQAVNMVNMHFKVRTRGLSLTDFKGHLLRVLNNMTSQVKDTVAGDGTLDADFILAGFCCHSKNFKMWLLHYDVSLNRFTFRRSSRWKGGNDKKILCFTGNYRDEFKNRLTSLLKKRRKLNRGWFNMEPFEVLRDMIRENEMPLIGGPPQIVKVYRSINCIPFAVAWPNRESGVRCLLGRPLLKYERHDHLNIDPDTLEVFEDN